MNWVASVDEESKITVVHDFPHNFFYVGWQKATVVLSSLIRPPCKKPLNNYFTLSHGTILFSSHAFVTYIATSRTWNVLAQQHEKILAQTQWCCSLDACSLVKNCYYSLRPGKACFALVARSLSYYPEAFPQNSYGKWRCQFSCDL